MASNANAKKSEQTGLSKFFARIKKFFRDFKGETKKVVWPSRKQIINNTLVVIAFLILAAVIVGVLDLAFGSLLRLLIGA